MGNTINELLLTELENLEKEPEIRREAMKKLRSYIENLDPKFIHLFLARSYEIEDLCSPSGECILYLLEILIQTHGCDIVPHIEKIMEIVVRTLSSSRGPFTLNHSFFKNVGYALLRYGINPLMSETEKARIICSICKPLSNLLVDSHKSAAFGSAISLDRLVESVNWNFASNSIVNEILFKLSIALKESQTQTTGHMRLITTLSWRNPLIVDAYSGGLICCGIQILTSEVKLSFEKRLSAIKMINMLMKHVDARSILSEIDKVVDVMDTCQCDSESIVSRAAYEAFQTAKTVAQQHKSLISSTPFVSSNSESNSNSSNRSNVDELEVEGSPFTNGTHTMETLKALSEPMHNSRQNSRPGFDDDIDGDVNTHRKLNIHIQTSSQTTTEDGERQNSRMILSPRSIQYEAEINKQTAEEKAECRDKNDVRVLKGKRRGCGKTLIFFISCFLVVFVAFILSNGWNDEVYFVPT